MGLSVNVGFVCGLSGQANQTSIFALVTFFMPFVQVQRYLVTFLHSMLLIADDIYTHPYTMVKKGPTA